MVLLPAFECGLKILLVMTLLFLQVEHGTVALLLLLYELVSLLLKALLMHRSVVGRHMAGTVVWDASLGCL